MQACNYLRKEINKHLCLILTLFTLIFFYPNAYAHINNQQIIQVEADSLQFNNDTKVGIYQGHVKLEQGDRILTADYATSYSNQEGEIIKIIALGNPAVYKAFIFHERPKLIASGNTIYYYPLKDYLEAVGNARIVQEQNLFRGPQINYDFKKKTVVSPLSKEGHTQITLAPIKALRS